jgi:hypothetical protein
LSDAKLLDDLRQVVYELEVEEREWNEIVVRRAIATIEQLTKPLTLIDPCLCGVMPVVLEDSATGKNSIGCRQAFFKRSEDQAECKARLSVVDAVDREHATESWNEAVRQRRGS